jgi:hypothetical protein
MNSFITKISGCLFNINKRANNGGLMLNWVKFLILTIFLSTIFSQDHLKTFIWYNYRNNMDQNINFIDALETGKFNYVILDAQFPKYYNASHSGDIQAFISDLKVKSNIIYRIDVGDKNQNNTMRVADDTYLKILYDDDYWTLQKQQISAFFTEDGELHYTPKDNKKETINNNIILADIAGVTWDFEEHFVTKRGIHNYNFESNDDKSWVDLTIHKVILPKNRTTG